MVDLFWGRRLNAENYRDWIRAEGVEELHARLAASGKGAVGICIHQGNWEWAGLLGGLIGIPLTTVAENFKNPRLDTIFARMRETTGQTMIPQENALLKMLRAVRRRGVTAMLIDLNLRPTQAATVVKAFGEAHLEMCVPLLHAVLAQRAGALLVPIETRSFDRWHLSRPHPPRAGGAGRCHRAGDRAALLGFLGEADSRPPGRLALALQAFPLSAGRRDRLPALCARVEEVR